MTKAWLFLAGCAVLATPVAAAAQTTGLPESNQVELAKGLGQFGFSIFDGARTALAAEGMRPLPNPDIDPEALRRDFRALGRAYNSQMSRSAAEGALVRSSGDLLITGGTAIGALTGVGAIPLALAGAGAQWVNGRVAAEVQREGEQRATRLLGSRLESWNETQHEQFQELVRRGRTEEAISSFDQATGLLTELRSNLDAQGAEVAEQYITQTLAQTTREALRLAAASTSDTASLRTEFAQFSRGISTFAEQTKTRLTGLERDLGELNGRLTLAEQDIASLQVNQQFTANQLAATQDILFGQAPLDQRIQMLERGLLPHVPAGDRAKMLSVLRAEQRREEVVKSVASTLTAARDVGLIMQNLGVRSPTISRAIQIANVGVAAVSAYATGNYLGAAVAVTSLFGGGGADPDAARFEAIMQSLAEINRKLDTVIELQRQTLEALNRLSQQLANFENRTYERFDRVDFALKQLGSQSREQLWQPFGNCQTAWDFRNDERTEGREFDTERLRFVSIGDALRFSTTNAPYATACLRQLEMLFSTVRAQEVFGNNLSAANAVTNTALTFQATPNEDTDRVFTRSELQLFLEHLYRPATQILVQSWQTRWGNRANLFGSLAAPARSAPELEDRLRTLAGSNDRKACRHQESLLGKRLLGFLCGGDTGLTAERTADSRALAFLRDPIEQGQIISLGNWIAVTSRHADLLTIEGRPVQTLSTLPANGLRGGRRLLASYTAMLDIAIAQQAMLYGDLTAEAVRESVWDAERGSPRLAGRSAAQEAAFRLLSNENNHWLQRNVLLLALHKSVRPQGSGAQPSNAAWLAYDMFLAGLDKFNWSAASAEEQRRHLGDQRAFLDGIVRLSPDAVITSELEPGEGGVRKFYLTWPGIRLELPTSRVFKERRLVYPQSLDILLGQRAVFAEKVAEYDLMQDLPVNQLERVAQVLLAATPNKTE